MIYFGSSIKLFNKIDLLIKLYSTTAIFTYRFVCECAKKAEKMNFDYFGIEFHGECWGGSSPRDGRKVSSDSCIMVQNNNCAFESCHEQRGQGKICVGGVLDLFVYRLQKGR